MQTNIQTQAARNSDPSSSHEAAENITAAGTRQTHIRKLTEFVINNPGMTSAEIARDIAEPEIDRTEAARRLSDAKGVTVVSRKTEKKCSESGVRCLRWYPVDDELAVQVRGSH